MSKIHLLRAFLNERLTAAAEEIFGVVEKTISEYQEELVRLQSLLDIVLQPTIKLHRAELQQLTISEFPPEQQQHRVLEWSPIHGLEDPEPTQIKEELQRCPEEEQFQGLEEDDNDCTPVFVKSDHYGDITQSSHLYQAQKEGNGDRNPLPITTTEKIKTEPNGEDYGESEPTHVPHTLTVVNPEYSAASREKDLQQLNISVSEAELPPEQQHSELEWRPSHGQEDPESTQIKKDLEEIWSSQEEEQLQVLEEDNSDSTPAFVQSNHYEDPTKPSYFYEAHKEDKGVRDPLPSTTTEQIKTEPDVEDYRESEPTSVPQHPTIVNPECSAAQSEMGVVGSTEKHFNQVQSKRTNMLKGQVSHINTTDWTSSDLSLLQSPNQMNATSCCKVCGKTFHHMGSLFKHMQTHTKEKEGGVSGNTFHPTTNMKAPTPTHTAPMFCCHVCGQWFSKNSTLLMHLRRHTREKYLSCPVCCICFKQSGNLKRHMRIHTGEKPYCCCHCGKGFNQSGSLKSHMRSHTGEKPFQCTDCGREFSNSSNLTKHTRIHTGEKPFSCPECNKSFTQSGQLKNHMVTHIVEK
uniref:C2H2-type domain-containing protein n=1 Tax=Esox lucius TaxID=8010 RepID=A0AAY5KR57_ESOLU